MRKGLIWGGFGALLLVGIGSGFAPDFMLARDLAAAREEGLLTLPPVRTVAKGDDARLAYEAAVKKYPQGMTLLEADYARQVKRPAPHVAKYLDAMAEGAMRTGFSPIPDEREYRGYVPTELQSGTLLTAAKALAARATDEAGLLPAARMTGQLGARGNLEVLEQWAGLVPLVLDRARDLDLPIASKRRLCDAIGPPISSREALRRHIAENIEAFKGTKSASGTRREMAYLRFWRDFFARSRAGAGFAEAVRKATRAIEEAESRAERYVDIDWPDWAESVEKANARLAAER